MKINPANGELLNYTVWASYLKGKERPNSIRITGLGTAPDGSLLMVGNAAHHLIQTGDAIHHDPMEVCGPYITILADDWSSIRFSTCLEGTAWTSIRHGEQWDMQARRVGNRQLAAFVGSATATVAQTDPPRPPPSRNPLQSAFGGGHCDGYLVVVDLGP
jgi:hypothetical protein